MKTRSRVLLICWNLQPLVRRNLNAHNDSITKSPTVICYDGLFHLTCTVPTCKLVEVRYYPVRWHLGLHPIILFSILQFQGSSFWYIHWQRRNMNHQTLFMWLTAGFMNFQGTFSGTYTYFLFYFDICVQFWLISVFASCLLHLCLVPWCI